MGLLDSLFGRMALLLIVVIIGSHILALSLMLELSQVGPPLAHHGSDVRSQFPPSDLPVIPPIGIALDIAVRLGALLIAAWIGAKWLTRPFQRLANAAREMGRDIRCAPLTEIGTRECRDTTRVFNQMQMRICEQINQRDLFVAAVSHDLRTPLTRLALQVEKLSDSKERASFRRNLAEMEAMIGSTLDYLRAAADSEPWVPLDVGALLSSLTHDAQDCGENVQLLNPCTAQPLLAQASAMRRCVSNLLSNAVRYGGEVKIQLIDHAEHLQIVISDSGPGIAESEITKVMTPFYRIEASRNRNSGGVGLGLSIANSIAQAHDGNLTLRNALQGGLIATLTFPRHHKIATQ